MSDQSEPATLGEFNGHEIYPMPMFAKISVTDIAAVARWYEQALGFAVVFQMPDPDGQPALVHMRRKKYQDLLLVPARANHPRSDGLSLNFSADGEVDVIAERARSVAPVGVSSVAEPVDTPWNTRDLNVIDPAGNQLIFTGRQQNPDPQQTARWKATFARSRVKLQNEI
jgi:uncharacterized glyoxalase superfamily protein PhnB